MMDAYVKANFMTADEVASLLGTTANSLRQQVRKDPRMVGFPVCMIGSSIWIPREGFKNWMTHGNVWASNDGVQIGH